MIDLDNLGQYRENNRIEAKRAQGGLPHSIWETYSAFANSFGGVLLLGVVEQKDKRFASVPLQDPEGLAEEFWTLVNDRAVVSANILRREDVQVVESGGNRIVTIQVPRADRHDRPVYLGAEPFSGAYRRNGEGDYHCTAEEVRNMLRDRSDVSQDGRLMAGMGLEVLEGETLRRYRAAKGNTPEHRAMPLPEFLQQVGGAGRDENGVWRPTAAGLLMFAGEPQIRKEFPHFLLDYQEKDTERGPITHRIRSDSGDWSGNVCDFYFRVRDRLTRRLSAPFGVQVGERPEEAPIRRAIQEALANAILHANYYDRQGLVIYKTPAQVVISNPGAFRIKPADAMEGGVADPRNQLLGRLFHHIGVGRQAGQGMGELQSLWQGHGGAEQAICESLNPDRTTLRLDLEQAQADRRKQAILELLTRSIRADAAQLAQGTGCPADRIEPLLAQLLAEGAVVAEGEGPGRRYQLRA